MGGSCLHPMCWEVPSPIHLTWYAALLLPGSGTCCLSWRLVPIVYGSWHLPTSLLIQEWDMYGSITNRGPWRPFWSWRGSGQTAVLLPSPASKLLLTPPPQPSYFALEGGEGQKSSQPSLAGSSLSLSFTTHLCGSGWIWWCACQAAIAVSLVWPCGALALV